MFRLLPTLAVLTCLAIQPAVFAAEPATPPTKAEVEALLMKAQEWLLAQQQPDGAFLPGKQFVVGVTAMSVDVLAKSPVGIPASDPRIAKALALLRTHYQASDGGTYAKEEGLGNYGTSFTLMALLVFASVSAHAASMIPSLAAFSMNFSLTSHTEPKALEGVFI